MPSLNDFSRQLEEYFEEEKVELVITHWRGSMHPRHINTHDAVTQAVKFSAKKEILSVLYMERLSRISRDLPLRHISVSRKRKLHNGFML